MKDFMDFFNNNYSWLIPLIIGGIVIPFIINWLNKNKKKSNINKSKVKGNNSTIVQVGEVNINDKNKNAK